VTAPIFVSASSHKAHCLCSPDAFIIS
jgi:hypothetical protein